ncbi:MAG: tRNA glutamyl-Q synthetase [Flavobacteriales bacterium]|nr:tRNA glutamyl-Q synthetase [Flavobacteriales bacterium]
MNHTITRIAPTPSGFLHAGNVFSFLLTRYLSKKNNAHLILRIDDIDKSRYRKEYVEDIFETLHFFEIYYQEGPLNVIDFEENYSQQLRIPQYFETINKLKNLGLLYACTCSRTDIQAHREVGRCKNNCRESIIPFDTANASWKIKLPPECIISFTDERLGKVSVNLNAVMGDFVVLRKDGLPSYQIASLCDDAAMQVNYIVRGEDLLPSTAAQLFLAKHLSFDLFSKSTFFHHPLMKDQSGNKMAKSNGSFSISDMRKRKLSKKEILSLIKNFFENIINDSSKSQFFSKLVLEEIFDC